MQKSPPRAPIRVLNPVVAERIAAGEVIERPSSVVKELVENSLDAGATEVSVILEDGGKALIEVLDNGHGMTREDLAICRLRHATSKLGTLDDLERIATLGFRGEALPSIAAASDLSILSRAEGAETAYEAAAETISGDPNHLNLRPITFGHFLGSPHGTRVQSRSLFSQIPARLKFLKAQAAEVSNVREWIERLAVARPGTGFRLISNDRTVLTLRPQDEPARVATLLSDNADFPLITATNDPGFRERSPLAAGGEPRVRIHWLQGLSLPQMRRVVQVVNGRAVRDRMLQQALLGAFKQLLLPGQFPAVALFVDIDPSELDVNVHPTKTEIRFLDSRKIFAAIQNVAHSLVTKHGAPTYATASDSMASSNQSARFFGFHDSAHESPSPEMTFSPGPSARSESLPLADAPLGTYVGSLFNTYLIHDHGDETVLIDQHAAHERIRYERLKANFGALHPQALLVPEAIKLTPETLVRAQTALPLLEQHGFEAEVFGEDTVLFRGIPSEWGNDDLRSRLKNLMERVLEVENPAADLLNDETLFEALASRACHSAIRAGDRLEPLEARALVQDLFQCENPWTCPHGRPTTVRLARGKIEEWFQRRV